jgi:hypothetical protein
VPVEVGLQNDEGYPHKGTLDYAAPSINQGTGTLAVRAILANPDRVLLPGYFVRVRIAEEQGNAPLIPDAALGSDQGGRYVLVVDKNNVVEQRKVTIGPRMGELRVIEAGLAPDDRVVVAGILRASRARRSIRRCRARRRPPAPAQNSAVFGWLSEPYAVMVQGAAQHEAYAMGAMRERSSRISRSLSSGGASRRPVGYIRATD